VVAAAADAVVRRAETDPPKPCSEVHAKPQALGSYLSMINRWRPNTRVADYPCRPRRDIRAAALQAACLTQRGAARSRRVEIDAGALRAVCRCQATS
jgi:hypothetical protein